MKFYTWVWHPGHAMSSKEDPDGMWASRSAAEEEIRKLRIALKDALDALGDTIEEVGAYAPNGNVIRQAEALLREASQSDTGENHGNT